ncbi:MAG: hypothetical protein ABIT01_14480, partial [Thermoanaerobaculia bacterium]
MRTIHSRVRARSLTHGRGFSITTPQAPTLRRCIRFIAASLVLLILSAVSGAARGQCTTNGTFEQFHPQGNPLGYGPAGHFKSGFAGSISSYTVAGARRLIVSENFGYTIYGLANPNLPTVLGAQDIESL